MKSQMKNPSSCPELVSLNPSMESDTKFQNFRSSYHAFRLGGSRGAKGEVSAILEDASNAEISTTGFETVLGRDGLSYEDRMDRGYAALCEYRLAYRQFRSGAALGAKGEFLELAKCLSVRDCRHLPVAQLAEFRKQLARREQALLQNDFQDILPLHLHFGAGRLGLGLVLPAMMHSQQPFVIVQRPSSAWANVLKAGRSEVRLNGSTLVTLDVVLGIRELDVLQSIGKRAFLLLSEDPAVLTTLVSRATSYSCSIGGKELDAALTPLVESIRTVHAQANMCAGSIPAPAPLYACENDHEAIEKLAKSMTRLVEVVPVLVDRVCTAREMREDGAIDVTTEDYEGDLVLSPFTGALAQPPIPFGGCTVRQPETAEGAAFLHRKKILTVNGTHTTLAFLTLVSAEPSQLGPPKGSYELVAFDIDNAVNGGAALSVGRNTWVWAVARQLILLYEFEEDVIRHTLSDEKSKCDDAHLVDLLLSGARTAVKRLSRGGDQTSRVLGGGVANRWRTRLANVQDFLQAQQLLSHLSRSLLHAAGVSEEELRGTVKQLVQESERFTLPPQQFEAPHEQTTRSPSLEVNIEQKTCSPSLEAHREQKTQLPSPQANTPAVLFDFDGTLGDTEVPAMEVAFWELAPYLPELVGAADAELDAACPVFVSANAGKAFEHMIEKCDKQRAAAGHRSIEETRTARDEPSSLLAAIDRRRTVLGLETISGMRRDGKEPLTLLMQQKEDTVVRLARAARPTSGTLETLETLRRGSVPFVIATTSGKPRVPVCVDTAGLRCFFPSDDKHIHSGESDFDPPKFKPAPDVYLRAAASVGRHPSECIAVEDSASGVGSASNAGIGLIVGYVGGGHIQSEAKAAHASMLMAGEKAQNKRGADIVLTHMQDLPQVVAQFAKLQASRPCLGGGCTPLQLTNMTISDPAGRVITRD